MSDGKLERVRSELQAELREAIERHLPAETSGLLRERLDALTKLEEERPGLEERISFLTGDNARLVKDNDKWRETLSVLDMRDVSVTDRELACTKREIECLHREVVIDLKEAHAKERVDEMRSVVHDVFGNNRFKYTRTGFVPVPVAGLPGVHDDGISHEYRSEPRVESHPTTEEVAGEGDVQP